MFICGSFIASYCCLCLLAAMFRLGFIDYLLLSGLLDEFVVYLGLDYYLAAYLIVLWYGCLV